MRTPRWVTPALTVGLSVLVAPSLYAVKVCFDYALYRAADRQGIKNCDPTPVKESKYLDAATLQKRLGMLGYERVSGSNPVEFGKAVFGSPGFAEFFLKPGDVIFLRTDHVGFVRADRTAPAKPSIDHFIQIPGESRTDKAYDARVLPGPTRAVVGDRLLAGGFFENDPVEVFLTKRTRAQGGAVEVWRPVRQPNPGARQQAECPSDKPTTEGLERFVGSWKCECKITIELNADGTGAWVDSRNGAPGSMQASGRFPGKWSASGDTAALVVPPEYGNRSGTVRLNLSGGKLRDQWGDVYAR